MYPLLRNPFLSFIKSLIPQLKQVVLTSGSTWTVPNDWNSTNNIIHCIGGGGGGCAAVLHPAELPDLEDEQRNGPGCWL